MRRRPKGSGTIGRDGSGFFLRIRVRGRPVYEPGFRTRQEVETRAALLRAESIHQRLGQAADPRLAPTLQTLSGPWLDRRDATHAAAAEDRSRWAKHLAPAVGHLRPDEIGLAELRVFVESKRAVLASGTIHILLALLSSLYEDLLERGIATRNPVRALPRSVRRLARPDHDPRTTPFLETLADVRRVYLALQDKEESIAVAFAIGALAGLRTGEVFALRWRSVDLPGRRILVSESVKGPTKDRDPRPVPILDPLAAVLEPWRLQTGGEGLVIPSPGAHVSRNTPGPMLRGVLQALQLHQLADYRDAWYACTRHTFASHWTMAGRSLRELQAILGHSTIAITERYVHLAPDRWAEGVHRALTVDLAPGAGVVGTIGQDTPGRARKRRPGR